MSLPTGEQFRAAGDETLLSAAQRAGWLMRFGCRNGNCGVCVARLCAGLVEPAGTTTLTLAPDAILLCRTRACSDIEIDLRISPLPGSTAQARHSYSLLLEQTLLTDGRWRLVWRLPPGRQPTPQPGQSLRWDDEDGRSVAAHIDIGDSQGRRLVGIAATCGSRRPLPCAGYLQWPLSGDAATTHPADSPTSGDAASSQSS